MASALLRSSAWFGSCFPRFPARAMSSLHMAKPWPSSSIILLSQSNQVLLLCRVKTSKSFPSAHVFPGGAVDSKQDGQLPGEDDAARHADSLVYRTAAIRECFEESGILLARGADGSLVHLDDAAREEARKRVHSNEVRFVDWLSGMGAAPDTDGLVSFTRWITPHTAGRRFTTQMYLYMLPVSTNDTLARRETAMATPDGGIEHTTAAFDDAHEWLRKQDEGKILVFPPQHFLLTLVSRLVKPSRSVEEVIDSRKALMDFLTAVPAHCMTREVAHKPTSLIPWTDKVMSPHVLFVRKGDGRVVLGLDRPGPELRGTGRGGDWEHVILVNFTNQRPTNVEVRYRQDVLREARQAMGGREPDADGFVLKI